MQPHEIRAALNQPVRFTNPKLYTEGAEYILSGAVFRRDKKTGEFYYQAELTDKNVKHSVIYCRLEEIERSDDP
jgi:hypothetical protein